MNHFPSTEQVREANEALARGQPVRFGDTVLDLSVARYHSRRDDGVFIPLYIDGMADADSVDQAMAELLDEAESLRSAGHQVL